MEERQSRVEEKPATYKKKGQVYLLASIGLIAILLFANMVYNISSRKDKDDQEIKKTAPSSIKGANNDPDRFQKILSDRQKRQQKEETVLPSKSPYDRQLSSTKVGTGNQNVQGRNVSGAADTLAERQRKLVNDVEARFKAQEVERALKARQTSYADTGNAIARPGGMGMDSSPSFGKKDDNASRIADIGQQRSALQARIKMLESQGMQHSAEGQRKLQEARSSLASQYSNAQKNISGNSSNQESGDFGGSGGNGGNPTDSNGNTVVGYPSDNLYNANTEGKVKLPTGAEINAISTYTAISDYSGGSMKAMVSTDVLDASNSYVLFPKGSELLIKAISASGVNQVIQNRMAFTVQWLVLPNGDRVDFRKQSVLDRMGTPAVKADEVDYHIMAQILGVAAYAMVGTSTSYEGTGDGNESFAGNFGQGARQQASGVAQKFLQIVPTRTIHAGQPIRILIEDEMFVTPWKTLYENYVD